MFEKVNPCHPDKVADRIAGAIVDLAYTKQNNPKVAVEVLLGHSQCTIMSESSVKFTAEEIASIVSRIAGDVHIIFIGVAQDDILSANQRGVVRCGDNGIFKGVPMTKEQKELASIARDIFDKWSFDGKYIINNDELVICQSNATRAEVSKLYPYAQINPLGYWTGGINVDAGATNRKLGSDMGDAVTGGGLHGKDLSKADVSLNIYCHLMAQETGREFKTYCAIGDEYVCGRPYREIVDIARKYIANIGGFEKFAEWGLIR